MTKIALNSQKSLVVLESQNENTKIYNFNDKEIMLYISRAYDEESKRHFLTYDIPEIKELGVQRISDLKEFESAEVRDFLFNQIDEDWVEFYIKNLVIHINKNKAAKVEEEEPKIIGKLDFEQDENTSAPSEEIKGDE